MKQIRKGCNDFKMVTLGVAFCALMLATTANAAVTFGGAIVPGCALNASEKTYVCEESATTSADIVSLSIDYVVIMLGGGVMKGSTITLLGGSAVQGDLEAFTTITIHDNAQVTGDVTAGSTFWMAINAQVDGNVTAGSTFTTTLFSRVLGNVTAGSTATLGADAYVCKNMEGGPGSTTATLGVRAYVHGNVATAVGAVNLGAGAWISGDVTAGAAAGLGAGAWVNGDVTAGGAANVGAGAWVNGDVTAVGAIGYATGCIGGTIIGLAAIAPAEAVRVEANYICPAPLRHPHTRCSPIIYGRENY
jgi:predicted acyltransferase (DUF342 family)